MSAQIYELIPKVMADIGAIQKNRKNEQQKYNFRGIEDFYFGAHPAFVKHGIFCVPKVTKHECLTFEKQNYEGKSTTWRHVTVEVTHQFCAPDGSHVDVVTVGEGLDNSDKATNKAMSGAMKYALIELFCVPTQDIEDSDRNSPEAGRPVMSEPKTYTRAPKSGGAGDPVLDVTVVEQGPTTVTAAAPEYIDMGRQKNIHMEWRKAVRKDFQGDKDFAFYDWLFKQGFVDSAGAPTTSVIPLREWDEVKAAALAKARSL